MTLRKTLLACAALCAALSFAAAGSAITYGQLDGNRHPQVGALVGTFSSGTYPYCSGALISPTVFLTAAHCNIGKSRVKVTFDSQYTASSKLYSGTYRADPAYNQAQSDPHDIAVVVLDRAIKGVTPARLPKAGYFDTAKLTQSSKFTAVGYGGQERNFDSQGAPVIAYYDAREYSVSSFNSLNPAWLRLSQNNAVGDGGTCYGDSGGPNFIGAGASETNVIAGTTITGDAQCVSTNVIYRVDTASARNFLKQFVTLP